MLITEKSIKNKIFVDALSKSDARWDGKQEKNFIWPKLGVNKNFRQFLGVICAKNLHESEISSSPWGTPYMS